MPREKGVAVSVKASLVEVKESVMQAREGHRVTALQAEGAAHAKTLKKQHAWEA